MLMICRHDMLFADYAIIEAAATCRCRYAMLMLLESPVTAICAYAAFRCYDELPLFRYYYWRQIRYIMPICWLIIID